MAHLWVRLGGQTGEWAIAALPTDGRGVVLTGQADGPVAIRAGDDQRPYIARRATAGQDAQAAGNCGAAEEWMLMVPPAADVRVNGGGVQATGLKVLRDRDAIAVGQAGTMFFSTERRAVIEPFPGIGKPAQCPRCQQPIQPGTPSVRCPGCSLWFHQDPAAGLPCWTYAETCSMCDQRTALDADFQWTPAGL